MVSIAKILLKKQRVEAAGGGVQQQGTIGAHGVGGVTGDLPHHGHNRRTWHRGKGVSHQFKILGQKWEFRTNSQLATSGSLTLRFQE
jgi:hypothetical protein